ncbi:MAG: arginine repressor [Lachnospiraceae bacterium]|nr:arginine repressor [Lachnospiraceae bacterium]MBR4573528.1 arginine repressor [Lachnospiraceae bacterium]
MKNYRHQKIMEIIQSREVETQEELAGLLRSAGFNVTQATVSRDIRQLNLKKVPASSGRQCYAPSNDREAFDAGRLEGILRAGFVSMEAASNILVIRTVSGMAMAVAAAIDALSIPKMIGCIAGDDTIMCAIRSQDDVESVMGFIDDLLGGIG